MILIPELPFDLERVCQFVGRRFDHNYAPILVVAEGAQPVGGMPETKNEKLDQFGHVALGGIAHWLEGEIEQRTGKETRATVLGHVQRGGTRRRSTVCWQRGSGCMRSMLLMLGTGAR